MSNTRANKIIALNTGNSPELQHILDTYKPGVRVRDKELDVTGVIIDEAPFSHPFLYRFVRFDGLISAVEVHVNDLEVI